MSSFPHVLAPGRMGSLELANRIVMAPITTRTALPDGSVSDQEIALLARRAAGGVGMVTTGAMLVCAELETPGRGVVRLDDDAQVPALRRLVDAVHAAGSAVCVQLTVGAGRAGGVEPGHAAPVSSSRNTWTRDDDVVCRPLEAEEVRLLVMRFGEAVARAAAAGADAVDVHAHAGHLVDQFLSAVWNRRSDRYGGTVANRVRFAAELVEAAHQAADLPVGVRISGDQHLVLGRGVDESLEVARLLVGAGADLLVVGEGAPETRDRVVPPAYVGDAPALATAAAVRQVVRVPVMVTGSLTPQIAEKALADGEVDLVGFGRALLADPDLPRHLAAGTPDLARPCIRCNERCIGAVDAGLPVGCAVNPVAGHERRRVPTRAPRPKRVVVVGGGPAGLEAARVAAERGHQVDLYERTQHLGGMLRIAGTVEGKAELRRMVDWWVEELRRLHVAVHLGRDISPGAPVLRTADEVVVATGSLPVHPVDVSGLDRADVIEVVDVHRGAHVGERVVVAGGGMAGADVALDLATAGHRVTVVERTDDVARDVLPINRTALLRRLAECGVTLLTGHTVRSVEDGVVVVHGRSGARRVECDTVVVACGTRPNLLLAGRAPVEDPHVHLVGDCVEPGMVGDAVHSAWAAASRL